MVAAANQNVRPIDLARELLGGALVVLIGGDRREAQEARLIEELGLKEAIWIPTRPRDASPRAFQSVLRRGDATLVVSLLGLLRHQHARDIRSLCRRLGVPVITVWRSPSPAGIAAAIESQGVAESIASQRAI